MNDKLKAIEFNLFELAKRINQLNYVELNNQIDDTLDVLSDLMYEIYDAIETIEILIDDNYLSNNRIN